MIGDSGAKQGKWARFSAWCAKLKEESPLIWFIKEGLKPVSSVAGFVFLEFLFFWKGHGSKFEWYNLWLTATKSPEIYLWLIIPFYWFLLVTARNATLAEKSLKELPELNKKLDQAKKIGLETVEVCIKFLNSTLNQTVLNPKDWVNFTEGSPDRVSEGIKSLGANLSAWSERIKQHREIERNNPPPYLTNTWLGYLETYFREEAFDISRGEIVTNGRNYPFLLITTLSSLLEHLPDNHYLHYYVVTPVNPKDWYNWPHGRAKPKCYCEADFLSLFHRSLQEFLFWEKNNRNRLVHARFILASDSPTSKETFGWKLDLYEDICKDLQECLLINFALPISKFPQISFWDDVQNYYSTLLQQSGLDPQKVHVVPVFGNHWKNRLENLEKSHAISDLRITHLKNYAKNMINNFENLSREGVTTGISNTITHAEEALRKSINRLKEIIPHPNTLEKLIMNAINPSINCNFPLLVKCLHKASIESASGAVHSEDIIKEILIGILRHRAAKIHCSSTTAFQKLGDIFANQLHSKPENAFVVRLRDSGSSEDGLDPFDYRYWLSTDSARQVEPEFAIFGVSQKPECSINDFQQIQWKLALSSDISYPFETTKIRIFDNADILAPYTKTVRELLSGLNDNKTVRMINIIQNRNL